VVTVKGVVRRRLIRTHIKYSLLDKRPIATADGIEIGPACREPWGELGKVQDRVIDEI
tara:strand:- start:310 stop:483 length:174 start_codon:yes stop_codon:yes gene_type:complete